MSAQALQVGAAKESVAVAEKLWADAGLAPKTPGPQWDMSEPTVAGVARQWVYLQVGYLLCCTCLAAKGERCDQ